MEDAAAPLPLTASSEAVPAPPVAVPRRTPPVVGARQSLLYLGPALAVYALFVLWPLLRAGWIALQRWDGYGAQTFVGLQNFVNLAGDPVFRTSLEHSVAWEFAAAIGVTAGGLGLALLVCQSRLQSAALAALFFPALLPATVVAAVWALVYSPLNGLANTVLNAMGAGTLAADWLGNPRLALPALFVAWTWSSLGVGTLVFWAGLRSIGREYIELAVVEGAGAFWRFRHVLLPALRRTTIIVMLVNAALAGGVFDLVMVTTGGGPGYATMLLPVDMYGRAFGGAAGQGAAVAVVQVLIGLVLGALALSLGSGDQGFMGDGSGGESATGSKSGSQWATAGLALVLLLSLLPLLWLLVVALGWGNLTVGATTPTLAPSTWGWSNFSSVWTLGMGGALVTSLALAVGATALTVVLAPSAAFALLHAPRRWATPVAALLGIGLFQPTPVIIVPLFALLKDLGLLDSPAGVVLPEVARNLPFAVLLLWAFFTQLPVDVMHAARVDGASPFRLLLHVALPLVRPALFAVVVWAFVGSWNEYLLPTLVSQDGSLQTVPTLLGSFIGRFDTQFGLLAAGSLLALAPTLAVYVVFRRPAGSGLFSLERRLG